MRRIAPWPGVWASLLLLAACASPAQANDGLHYRGNAVDLKSGKLLYRELHYISKPGTAAEARIVHYQCPADAGVFARKELDYPASRDMPRFTLTDALMGYAEGLRFLPNGRAQVFQVPGAGRSERNALLPAGKIVVSDAGFDEFLRRHWAELERGDSVNFSFLVPSRLHWIEFRIHKEREDRIEGAAASVIRLNLAGVMGWFLPFIEVSYRKTDRALMRYKGLTNLRNAAGDNFAAQIDFPLAERRELPVDLAALRAVPLVRRCG